MALRNQPYIPLYIQDYLTDEKLNMCSAASQGIFIKIMCIMHKSDEYGTVLLKQNDKQNQSTCLNFATKLARLLPFEKDELHLAIKELVEEKVLYIENDKLCQKRMIHDNKISELRAISGSIGGKKTQKDFAKAKTKANSESEYVYENESKKHIEIIPFFNDKDFQLAWKEHRAVRIKKKGSPAERADIHILNELNKLSGGSKNKAILLLDQSARKGWIDIFPLKEPLKSKKKIIAYRYQCPSCKKEYHPREKIEAETYNSHRCEEPACQKIKFVNDEIAGYELKYIEEIYKEES